MLVLPTHWSDGHADGLSRRESQDVSRIVFEAGNDVLANLNVCL